MLRPMVLPPASCAPRFAASMMPGPPPVVTTKRRRRDSESAQFRFRMGAAVEARRSEEYDRILNLLPAKTGQGLHILRQDSQDAAVRAVEEGLVLIRQRRRLVVAIVHDDDLSIRI